jgi:hypothetical protein
MARRSTPYVRQAGLRITAIGSSGVMQHFFPPSMLCLIQTAPMPTQE